MINASHQLIGIMADSHGDPFAIDSAAAYLRQKGCTSLYHLGDICDTNRPDTADECVAVIRRYGILAIKGNNDHSLAADARGRPDNPVHRRTLAACQARHQAQAEGARHHDDGLAAAGLPRGAERAVAGFRACGHSDRQAVRGGSPVRAGGKGAGFGQCL